MIFLVNIWNPEYDLSLTYPLNILVNLQFSGVFWFLIFIAAEVNVYSFVF